MKQPSDSAKDNAIHFECKKLGMTQDKNGVVLKLVIHPDDLPEELMRSWVGAQYMAVLVEVTDQGEPKVQPTKQKRDRLLASAAMLCKEKRFWDYLGEITGLPPDNEDSARDVLCDYLGISSRSELNTNKQARQAFDGMVGDFEEWVRHSHGVY